MMVQAMREKAADMKAAQLKVFVRRGGPNWQAGLALMRQLGEDTGIPIEVYGPTDSMTGICQKALDFINASSAPIAAH
jgi:ATP citrate (pro-S)-lyase